MNGHANGHGAATAFGMNPAALLRTTGPIGCAMLIVFGFMALTWTYAVGPGVQAFIVATTNTREISVANGQAAAALERTAIVLNEATKRLERR